MLLLDQEDVQNLFQKKVHCFGTATVGLGLSTTAAVSANIAAAGIVSNLATTAISGGFSTPSISEVSAPVVDDADLKQEEKKAQTNIATSIKSRKAATRAGITSPTLLTGVTGISDDELNLGRNRII